MDGTRRFALQDLQAMASIIRHRGPDDEGMLISGPVGLGFRRLSIIDLSGGHQPMANEDKSIWIVFNGEIYNHPELCLVLQRLGHRYATRSDTETILHLYEEYGEDCVDHLRGMFAFVIWDTRRRQVFAARDRLGIKPFYYTLSGSRFSFASEIKCLLELPGFRPTLNQQALPELFAFGYLSGEDTLFAGVRKLMPGHCLRINLSEADPTPQIRQYWELLLDGSEPEGSEEDYLCEFSELFRQTVRSHLMSDVPLGVFLSGGLDSSAIAAEMAALRKDRIQTFSVGYAEDQFSELPYAREVAQYIGAEYNQILLGPDDFFSALPQLIWQEDEPLVWPSSVALYYVSRLASEKVKVVLTGEGGDELFAGYLKYRATLLNMRAARIYGRIMPGGLQQIVRRAIASGRLPDLVGRKLRHSFLYYPESLEQIYFDNFYSSFGARQQQQLFTPEFWESVSSVDPYANSAGYFPTNGTPVPLLDRLLYLDIKTYLVELLMKQDQMSMATSLESRVPFLDHKMVEFAARVPGRYKIHHFSGKYLLRKAMAGRLPKSVLQRTKKGFPTPIRPWLRNQLLGRLCAVLSDGRMAARGLVRQDYVQQLLEAHRQKSSLATEGCWRLLTFELWCRVFLDRDPASLAGASDSAAKCAVH